MSFGVWMLEGLYEAPLGNFEFQLQAVHETQMVISLEFHPHVLMFHSNVKIGSLALQVYKIGAEDTFEA